MFWRCPVHCEGLTGYGTDDVGRGRADCSHVRVKRLLNQMQRPFALPLSLKPAVCSSTLSLGSLYVKVTIHRALYRGPSNMHRALGPSPAPQSSPGIPFPALGLLQPEPSVKFLSECSCLVSRSTVILTGCLTQGRYLGHSLGPEDSLQWGVTCLPNMPHPCERPGVQP